MNHSITLVLKKENHVNISRFIMVLQYVRQIFESVVKKDQNSIVFKPVEMKISFKIKDYVNTFQPHEQ